MATIGESVPATESPLTLNASNREEHGRSLHPTNTWYILPADAKERERLCVQHEMFKHRFNGLVIPGGAEAVERVLSSSENPAVLDIGTGSGAWAVDMAILHSNARVFGIDLTPTNPRGPVPKNCEFAVHDANMGLKPYHAQFDVVHARCVVSGIVDWKGFLVEATACLKPSGVLLIVGSEGMRMFNELQEPIMEMTPGMEGSSYFNRLTMAVKIAADKDMRTMGMDVHLYTEDLLNAMDGKFVKCNREAYFVPLGAWDEDLPENEKIAAELQRQNSMTITDAFRLVLLKSGSYSSEEVEEIVTRARDEVENNRIKQYIRWYGVWAVRL